MDVYARTVLKNNRIVIGGNRTFTNTGNPFLLFFKYDNTALLRFQFAPRGTKSSDEYILDTGEIFSAKESGLCYGWQYDASRNAGKKEGHNSANDDTYIELKRNNYWKIRLPDGYYKIKLKTGSWNKHYGPELSVNEKEFSIAPGFPRNNWCNDCLLIDCLLIEDYFTISRFCNNELVLKAGKLETELYSMEIEKIEYDIQFNYEPVADAGAELNPFSGTMNIDGNHPCITLKHSSHHHSLPGIGLIRYKIDILKDATKAELKLYLPAYNVSEKTTGRIELYGIRDYQWSEQNADHIKNDLIRWDKQKFVFNEQVEYIGEQVIREGGNRYYDFNITDYLLKNEVDDTTFLIISSDICNEEIIFAGKEMGFNKPLLQITVPKKYFEAKRYLAADCAEFLTIEHTQYLLSGPYVDLSLYAGINLKINGYFDPLYKAANSEYKGIIISKAEVIPPEKPLLSAAYWNNDGFPVWSWNEPLGSCLFRYALDGGTWTEATALTFSPAEKLAEGLHEFKLQCKNRLSGWTEATDRRVKADLTPPVIGGVEYVAYGTDFSPSFSWQAYDNFTDSNELVYSYTIDEQPWMDSIEESCQSAELEEGRHTFKLRARDLAGNRTVVRECGFIIDVTPPEILKIDLVYPDDNGLPYYQWTAKDTYSAVLDYSYSIDGVTWINSRDNRYTPAVDYPHVFRIKTGDELENWSRVFEFSTDKEGLIVTHNAGLELDIRPGATDSPFLIKVATEADTLPADPNVVRIMSSVFALDSNPGNITFREDCSLTLSYDEKGTDESWFTIYRYDEQAGQWQALERKAIDKENNLITVSINHFSYYAVEYSFFRIGAVDYGTGKKWCFVDPLGNPFFSTGMNEINGKGNEGKNNQYAYLDAIKQKYGEDNPVGALKYCILH